jgi:class 3 adenylate cyclase/TolB-like protein
MATDCNERRLAAILSADVVGYSRLMAEDEASTVKTIGAFREEITLLVRQHRGHVVDFTGDNFLAEFPTATEAVGCAIEIQGVLKVRSEPLPDNRKMQFRIGVHLGEVRVEGERIYGDGVNIAARLEGLAEPGGICISGAVYEQVRNKLDLTCVDLGPRDLKNIPGPVHAYRVRRKAASTPATPTTPRTSRVVLAVTSVLLLAAVLTAWQLLVPNQDTVDQPPAPTSTSIDSLAVLPLANFSGDPEQEYFTDGMTDALIDRLARISSLRVISRTSVMQYRNAQKPLPDIARELNVDAIVEGSVLRAADQVRITAQLIDARNDEHLWSESYVRDLRNVLVLQSEVARAIAEQIKLKLTPQQEAQLETSRPVTPKAYEAYLRGRSYFERGSPADYERAVEYFEQAIQEDPNFAPAYAALANTFT